MEKIKTDKFSLLYNTDLETIEKRLVEYYKINLEDIFQLSQEPLWLNYKYRDGGDRIDKIFDVCYSYIKEFECNKAIVYKNYFYNGSSPSNIFTEFETQLKRHALLTTAYTLEDHIHTDSVLISDPLHKNTAQNMIDDFPNSLFDIHKQPYTEKNQQGISYYYRNFLSPLTISFFKNYKKKDGPKKFHVNNKIENIENKRLTKLLKDKFETLINFQQLIQHDICCTHHIENGVDEIYTEALNRYYKLLCFQKLESLTGASTLLFLLPYITNSAENKDLYKSIAFNRTDDKSFVMPDINDALLFQTLPNVFDRSTLIQKYFDKEITKNELLYLRDRVIPLLTNTFFCIFCKSHKNPREVIKTNLRWKLVQPTGEHSLSEEEIKKLISKFNKKTTYFDKKNYKKITEETILIKDKTPTLTQDMLVIKEKLEIEISKRITLSYEWYKNWGEAIFYISEEHTAELNPSTSTTYKIIMDFIDNCTVEERHKVIQYFFDNYASFKWFTPTSQLPDIQHQL